MSSIMTSIKQVDGGSVIKSGDTSSVFKFEILDDDFVKKGPHRHRKAGHF